MDHNKAYELIGSLSSTLKGVARNLEGIAADGPLASYHLECAKRILKLGQDDYAQFRKDKGWDTQGEK